MPRFVNVDQPEENRTAVVLEGEAAEKAFLSTKFGILDPRVNVRGPDNRINSIAREDLQKALTSGKFRMATDQEVNEQRRIDNIDTTGNALAAGIEGVASGVSLGLTDLIFANEAAKERAEFFPGIRGAGEFVGAVVPALVTGGASRAVSVGKAAARKGATETALAALTQESRAVPGGLRGVLARTPAGRVARLGEQVEAAVAESARAANLPAAITKPVTLASRFGVEATFFGAGQGITEAALGESEEFSEKLLAVAEGAGYGLLGGIVGGGALSGGAQVLKMGGRITKRGASALFENTFGEAAPKAVQSFKRGAKGFFEKEKLWRNRKQIVNDAIVEATESGDSLLTSSRKIADLSRASVKPKRVKELFSKADAATKKTMTLETQSTGTQLVSELREAALLPAADRELVESIANEMERRIKFAGDDAPSVYAGLDDAKRAIYNAQSNAWKTISRIDDPTRLRQAREYAQKMAATHKSLRTRLEDVGKFGPLAEMQAETNPALHAWFGKPGELGSKRQFESLFVLKDPGTREILGMDPKKIARHFNGLTNQRFSKDHQALVNHLQNTEDMVKTIEKWYELTPEELAFVKKTKRNIAKFRKTLATQTENTVAANEFNDLVRPEGISTGTLGTGAIVGGVFGGPGGFVLGGLAEAVINPATVVRKISAMRALADRFDGKTAAAVAKYFSAAKRGGTRAVRRVGAPTIALSMSKRRENMEKQREELGRLSSPEYMAEKMARDFAGVVDVAPSVLQNYMIKANQAVQLLQQRLPPKTESNPFQFATLPSETEIHRYEEFSRGVLNPTSVIEDLANFTTSPEAVEGLAQAHPRSYARVQRQILEKLVDTQIDLPYETAIHLGVLMRIPTHPSLLPDSLARLQTLPTFEDVQEPEEPGQPQRQLGRKSDEVDQTTPESDRLAKSAFA